MFPCEAVTGITFDGLLWPVFLSGIFARLY